MAGGEVTGTYPDKRRGRAGWLNVHETRVGTRWHSKYLHSTRAGAERAAVARRRQGWKLLYRIRIRWYLEPIT